MCYNSILIGNIFVVMKSVVRNDPPLGCVNESQRKRLVWSPFVFIIRALMIVILCSKVCVHHKKIS